MEARGSFSQILSQWKYLSWCSVASLVSLQGVIFIKRGGITMSSSLLERASRFHLGNREGYRGRAESFDSRNSKMPSRQEKKIGRCCPPRVRRKQVLSSSRML